MSFLSQQTCCAQERPCLSTMARTLIYWLLGEYSWRWGWGQNEEGNSINLYRFCGISSVEITIYTLPTPHPSMTELWVCPHVLTTQPSKLHSLSSCLLTVKESIPLKKYRPPSLLVLRFSWFLPRPHAIFHVLICLQTFPKVPVSAYWFLAAYANSASLNSEEMPSSWLNLGAAWATFLSPQTHRFWCNA